MGEKEKVPEKFLLSPTGTKKLLWLDFKHVMACQPGWYILAVYYWDQTELKGGV